MQGARPFDAWVDLDDNEWVPASAVGVIEKRRLLRLSPWVSSDKALAGGFVESFDDYFAKSGRLPGTALGAVRWRHDGAGSAFWLRVDHGLFRSNIELRYYDVNLRTSRPIPPALVLRAYDEQGRIVGGGVAIRPDGTIHVLHQRTSEQSRELHYGFQTPPRHALVDIEQTPPSGEHRPCPFSPPAPPPGVTTRYLLPEQWSSRGWQARLGGGPRQCAVNADRSRVSTTFHNRRAR